MLTTDNNRLLESWSKYVNSTVMSQERKNICI